MAEVVTMDKFGRLVLPGALRKALHLQKPAAFKAEIVGSKIELTLLPNAGAVIKRRKGLLVVSTGEKNFDALQALRALRDESL